MLSELLGILAENVQDAQENGDSHGEGYTYNTPNGSEGVYATTKLRELAGNLEEVEDVVFSNPELLEVVKTEGGDWILRSLQAFDSEELLTIKLTNGQEIKIWVTDERAETYYQDAEGATWKVVAEYSLESGLPADVGMKVRELTEDEYSQYIEQTAEALDAENVNIAKAFDISFEKDGTQYHELKDDVKITIQLMDQVVTDSMEVVHIGEETQVMDTKVRGDTLSFTSDGFSVFVVITSQQLSMAAFSMSLRAN